MELTDYQQSDHLEALHDMLMRELMEAYNVKARDLAVLSGIPAQDASGVAMTCFQKIFCAIAEVHFKLRLDQVVWLSDSITRITSNVARGGGPSPLVLPAHVAEEISECRKLEGDLSGLET